MMTLLSVGVLVTFSRGAAICILASVGVLLLSSMRVDRSWTRVFTALLTFSIIVTAILVFLPDLADNFSTRVSLSIYDRLNNRLNIYPALWWAFLRKPFFGYGLNSTSAVTRNYAAMTHIYSAEALSPHSVPLGVLVDGGLMGGMLFLGVLISTISVLRQLFRNKNAEYSGNEFILIGILSLLAATMFLQNIMFNKLAWLCLALTEAAYGLSRNVDV